MMKKLAVLLFGFLLALASCVSPPAHPATDTSPGPDKTSAVQLHGSLSIVGTQLVDQSGAPVQLKGMSLFWSQWGGRFYNNAAIDFIHNDWNASVIRVALGVENGGYLANPSVERAKAIAAISAAIASGIYVIIDWHDHHAEQHTAQARAFFADFALRYKDTPNVLFEIYNEPWGKDVSWAQVKEYAKTLVTAIRQTGANNVILIGSPDWSQHVDMAAEDPVIGTNLAYTLHFYAGSHKKWLRDRADAALERGIAIFVTEWGTCDSSGNGGFSPEESDAWISWMDAHAISWCNWALNDKNETASVLKSGASGWGGWKDGDLTKTGLYVRDKMRK